ncbi:hypothetical protein LXL04_006611 [Taraxacum kok-saghyz]
MSREDAEKAQQAMSSLSPERNSRVMSIVVEYVHDAEELKAVNALRQYLISEDLLHSIHDDYYMLLRFLKARKFDIEKTKLMWADMLQWRKEFGDSRFMIEFYYRQAHTKLFPCSYDAILSSLSKRILLLVVVLGGGSFGTAMASHVEGRKKQMEVNMLVRNPQICQSINQNHCNGKYFPDHKLPENVIATTDAKTAFSNADFCLQPSMLYQYSTWISFVRKNSNKGHFRKAVAVWGCLGNLLLSLIRKWLQVHRMGLIIFLYRDLGLLRDLANPNCRGQFRYFGTWQLFFCIGTWQLMGLMLKWLFMEESITDLTRKRFMLLICDVDWDHSCKEIVWFPYNFLCRFGPNLDNFKRIKRKRFSKDDKKRDIKIIDKIFNCKGCLVVINFDCL